jgi:hypothetical protein
MIVSWLHKGYHRSMKWLELSIRCSIDLGHKGPIVTRPHQCSNSSLWVTIRFIAREADKVTRDSATKGQCNKGWRKRYVAQGSAAHLVTW